MNKPGFIGVWTLCSPADAHGEDQWAKIKKFASSSARDYLLYADDYPKYQIGVIRVDNWKLFGWVEQKRMFLTPKGPQTPIGVT
jgi:hypothetical protein